MPLEPGGEERRDSRDRLDADPLKEKEEASGVTQRSPDTCPEVLAFTTPAMSVLL